MMHSGQMDHYEPPIKHDSPPAHHESNPAGHANHESHDPADHHAMMVADFRRRFFISIVLMLPILVLSPMIP